MAYGDIGAVIDTVTVKTGTTECPFVIRVGAGVFAVFYCDTTSGVVLKTYSVNAAGTISNVSVTDTVVDATISLYLHVIHISGTIYAVVYRGAGSDGFITTVDIATNGTINDANIATYEFSTHDVWWPFICHLRANIYAITYYDSDDVDGVIATVSISTDGTTISLIAAWHFDTSQTYRSSCLKVTNNIVWVTYEDSLSNGYMFCVAISDAGAITAARITDWNYTALNEYRWPIKVGSQKYALAGHWTDNDGWVNTVTIADNGNITATFVDQKEFDISNCRDVQILSLGDIYYGVCYRGSADSLMIATYWITAAGDIKDANIDWVNLALTSIAYHRWCWATDDIYVIVYEDTVDDIILISVDVETAPPAEAIHHEMLMGIGP